MSPSDASNAVTPFAARALAGVQSCVGLRLQRLDGAFRSFHQLCEPDTNAAPEQVPLDLAAEALHRLLRLIDRRMRKNDGEFVSPNAVSAIFHSKRAEQRGERREHAIAVHMPIAIVDDLEIVDV
jgi:hypothetical protein